MVDESRICTKCGKVMQEGFIIESECEYYCDEPCLHSVYTEQEWEDMCNEEDSDCYWTQWY